MKEREKERCLLVSRRFQVAAGSALEKRGSSLLKIHVVVLEVDEYLHRLTSNLLEVASSSQISDCICI